MLILPSRRHTYIRVSPVLYSCPKTSLRRSGASVPSDAMFLRRSRTRRDAVKRRVCEPSGSERRASCQGGSWLSVSESIEQGTVPGLFTVSWCVPHCNLPRLSYSRAHVTMSSLLLGPKAPVSSPSAGNRLPVLILHISSQACLCLIKPYIMVGRNTLYCYVCDLLTLCGAGGMF